MKYTSFSLSLSLFILFFYQSSFAQSALDPVQNYEEGLTYAKVSDGTIFLLFTGSACKNNIKLKQTIKSSPSLRTYLTENFVNVHLHVDDKTPLPTERTVFSTFWDRELNLRNYGNLWGYIETEKYNSNIQPLIIFLDKNENVIAGPFVYNDKEMTLEELLKKAGFDY